MSLFSAPASADVTRRFEAIREAAREGGIDPFDRDAFLMLRPVIELVHASRPDEGIGEGIDLLAAFTHLSYLHWVMGSATLELGAGEIQAIVGEEDPPARPPARPPAYAVAAARAVWGAPTDVGPEPLDGWLAARAGDRLMVVALFGARPERGGASVVAVEGCDPGLLARPDGTPLFASTLPGGAEAGLYSLTGMEELLGLAWRVEHWRAGEA